MADLTTLKRDASAALSIVLATNNADIESGFNGTFDAIHLQAVNLVTATQTSIARYLGWLDDNGEPRPGAPAMSATLYDGAAGLDEVAAL